MSHLDWERVAPSFARDGGLRDIYVVNSSLHDWQAIINKLQSEHYKLIFRRGDELTDLPADVKDAMTREDRDCSTLSIYFAGALINCHFFAEDEIEFDVQPSEIKGQAQLDALLCFMHLLADTTGKDVILTPENIKELVIFRVHPNDEKVEYAEYRF